MIFLGVEVKLHSFLISALYGIPVKIRGDENKVV
jgi:hypothetical protein